jgi:hypothetical protein
VEKEKKKTLVAYGDKMGKQCKLPETITFNLDLIFEQMNSHLKGLDEDNRGTHVCMSNSKIESNGRRGKHEPVTMRILQREVHNYRDNNEKIMKS